MGAPKKPTALRELHGTLNRNKDRNNPGEPVPTKGIGPAPEHLNEMQRQAWDEIVGMMYPGVLGEADRIALEIMAKLLVDFRTNYEDFTGAKLAQIGAAQGLGHDVHGESAIIEGGYGEAGAIYRDAIAQIGFLHHLLGCYAELVGAGCLYPAHLFHNSGEQFTLPHSR